MAELIYTVNVATSAGWLYFRRWCGWCSISIHPFAVAECSANINYSSNLDVSSSALSRFRPTFALYFHISLSQFRNTPVILGGPLMLELVTNGGKLTNGSRA